MSDRSGSGSGARRVCAVGMVRVVRLVGGFVLSCRFQRQPLAAIEISSTSIPIKYKLNSSKLRKIIVLILMRHASYLFDSSQPGTSVPYKNLNSHSLIVPRLRKNTVAVKPVEFSMFLAIEPKALMTLGVRSKSPKLFILKIPINNDLDIGDKQIGSTLESSLLC
jgi:hypothetical protein